MPTSEKMGYLGTDDASYNKTLAEKEIRLAELRHQAGEKRRAFVGTLLGGLALLTAVLAIIYVIATTTADDRRIRADLARRCIAAGGAWIEGSCIPTTTR